jgi:hypothetical protein
MPFGASAVRLKVIAAVIIVPPSRELLLKGKAQYDRPPCSDSLICRENNEQIDVQFKKHLM